MKNLCASTALLVVLLFSVTACIGCGPGANARDSLVAPVPLLADPNPYELVLPPFSNPVTLKEVRLAYYKYSAPSIVRKLTEGDRSNWNMIMGKIVEGDEDWITYTATFIWPGADAGDAEEIITVMALGLTANPRAVLSAYNIPLLDVCSAPFIEPEYEFMEDYGKKTLAALYRLDEPYYLSDQKRICIGRLHDTMANLHKYYEGERLDK